MTTQEHLTHTEPLKWLVIEKLHKGIPFEERVRLMRARRWRDKLANKFDMMPTDEKEVNNEPQD